MIDGLYIYCFKVPSQNFILHLQALYVNFAIHKGLIRGLQAVERFDAQDDLLIQL